METKQVDVAVIGAGSAGLVAYRNAKQHTDSVVLIEGGPYGTTCARVGCMPSKLLIAAAEAAHAFEHASMFGVFSEQPPRIDGRKVMERVKSERDRFVGFVLESVEETIAAEDKIRGYAQFIDAHTLQVDDHTRIEARSVVIATGSRPSYPGFFKGAGSRLILNDDVFDWDDLPSSVAVFGPGVIGLELGQALHRLGVKVWMFGVGGLLGPFTDPELRDTANAIFSEEMYLDTDSNVELIEEVEDGVALRFVDKEGVTQNIKVDYLLAATGRSPNVDKIGLENLDLKLDERGVPVVNPFTMQCSLPHIFIAGDASNLIPLLHEAADQGRIAGRNAASFPDIRAGLRRSPIAVVFSDPQIAIVGMNRKHVEEQYSTCDCYAVGKVSFTNQGRSRVMGKNKGALHVYAEQGTGRFLGAEMIGPAAEHIAHLLAWAHQNKMTVAQMLDMPYYHPVVEEGLRTALRNLNAQLKLGPEIEKLCLECGPGC